MMMKVMIYRQTACPKQQISAWEDFATRPILGGSHHLKWITNRFAPHVFEFGPSKNLIITHTLGNGKKNVILDMNS